MMSSVRHGNEYQQVELHSQTHLHRPPRNPFASNSPDGMTYPPTRPFLQTMPVPLSPDTSLQTPPRTGSPKYDTERAQDISGLPYNASHSKSRSSSWDILSGTMKQFSHSYEEFDSRNANNAHLAYADGDVPNNKVRVIVMQAVSLLTKTYLKFSKLYNYLLNVSIVTRWIIFIVPILAILWIPGILSLTSFPNANVC
jgi:hypothetical protein